MTFAHIDPGHLHRPLAWTRSCGRVAPARFVHPIVWAIPAAFAITVPARVVGAHVP